MEFTRIAPGRYTVSHGGTTWSVLRLPGHNRTARWRGTVERDGALYAVEASSFTAVKSLIVSGAHARLLGKATPQ